MSGILKGGYVYLCDKPVEDFLCDLDLTEGMVLPSATKLEESVNHILQNFQESSDPILEKEKLGSNVWNTNLTLTLESLLPIMKYLDEIRWDISDEDLRPFVGAFIEHVGMVGKRILRQREEARVRSVMLKCGQLLNPK